ncbi:putative (E)-beta-ocimene synthase [Helianthus debilis subsp. tardiflorus]
MIGNKAFSTNPMALQLGQLVFPQRFFAEVCKPKPNIQQIVEVKCRQHRLICSGAKPNVSKSIYQPTSWSHDFIQLLDDNFPINCKEKMRELEKNVIAMNVNFENGSFSTLEVLEHIDDIDRLGLGYRFRNHIRRALDTMITSIYEVNVGHEESLHEASLRFKILRQHGYNVSQGNCNTFFFFL